MLSGHQFCGYAAFQLTDGIHHLRLAVSGLLHMTKLIVFVNFHSVRLLGVATAYTGGPRDGPVVAEKRGKRYWWSSCWTTSSVCCNLEFGEGFVSLGKRNERCVFGRSIAGRGWRISTWRGRIRWGRGSLSGSWRRCGSGIRRAGYGGGRWGR